MSILRSVGNAVDLNITFEMVTKFESLMGKSELYCTGVISESA
jgi:hypothetical protein